MTYCQNFNVSALVLQIATEILQSGLDLQESLRECKREEMVKVNHFFILIV